MARCDRALLSDRHSVAERTRGTGSKGKIGATPSAGTPKVTPLSANHCWASMRILGRALAACSSVASNSAYGGRTSPSGSMHSSAPRGSPGATLRAVPAWVVIHGQYSQRPPHRHWSRCTRSCARDCASRAVHTRRFGSTVRFVIDAPTSDRRLRVGCEFLHDLEWPVTFVLQVEPRPDAVRALSSAGVETWPPTRLHGYSDLYGNTCQRFVLGPGSVRIRYEAEVDVDSGVDEADETASQAAVADLPDSTLHFTLASRYCESDTLSNTAWRLFGDAPAGWQRVKAVVDWVHDNVTFQHGSTVSATGATDVYLQHQGV